MYDRLFCEKVLTFTFLPMHKGYFSVEVLAKGFDSMDHASGWGHHEAARLSAKRGHPFFLSLVKADKFTYEVFYHPDSLSMEDVEVVAS